MPQKLPTPCTTPGCAEIVHSRKCDKHTTEENQRYESQRPSAAERGYGRRWQKARRHYLAANPLCVVCQEDGDVVQATVVDHIEPHRGDMELFWDKGNWRAVCKPCHDSATAKYDGGFGNTVKGKPTGRTGHGPDEEFSN